ncbi:hypothetical protein BDZ89DRAFT_1147911 [Hymenopellis radicata]|nr:hypothetical protein BDZ89DRAFT_1147911 [Hymenopellis radicata]
MAVVVGVEPSFRARTRTPSPFVASPATTQKPPIATATTVDVDPQLTAKNVLHQCEFIFKRGESTTLCFPWFSDFSLSIYDDIRQCWARSDSLLNLRITSTAIFPIILELMPSGSHQMAAAGFATLITDSFTHVTHRYSHHYFVSRGATRVTINSRFKTEKQTDASFAPVERGVFRAPSVVIEVGRSETIRELRGDMSRWFSIDSIKLVILIEISEPTSAHPELPTLHVEMWYRVEDETKREPTLTKVVDENWSTGVPGPLEIPLWTLLGTTDYTEVPAGLPTQLELPVEQLELLRSALFRHGLSKPLYSISLSFCTDAFSGSKKSDSVQQC